MSGFGGVVIPYNVMDWYWLVGTSPTQVWSSARVAYVALDDATYQSWTSEGFQATPIDDTASLGLVMNQQWLPRALAQGVAVSSTSTPALNGTYSCDPNSGPASPGLTAITGISAGIAAGKSLPGGGSTFFYSDVTGAPHQFTGAQFLDFGAAIESYVYSLTQSLLTIIATGSGSLPQTPLHIT